MVDGDIELKELTAEIIRFIESPDFGFKLPLDRRGTEFQKNVWQAFREIPAGSTVFLYADCRKDWQIVREEMHAKGYIHVRGLLDSNECDRLITDYDEPKFYRKTITMERYRFGLGEYEYLTYPLPDVIQTIRETAYPRLAPIANQ
jgi:oxygenase catalysing oxidative methylation of damaged DNA